MAAQGADSEPVIIQFLLEFFQLFFIAQHGKLAMRIAWIIAGAEFDRVNVQAFQLLKYFVERKLRQQRGKTSNSHQRKRITAMSVALAGSRVREGAWEQPRIAITGFLHAPL